MPMASPGGSGALTNQLGTHLRTERVCRQGSAAADTSDRDWSSGRAGGNSNLLEPGL